jgi:glycosyltransferase involved in cell wall biosynthesis
VAFVYPNPRNALLSKIASGAAPDTNLLGANRLGNSGIEARVHDSVVLRKPGAHPLVARMRWHLRELVVPWELRGEDAIVTPLFTLLPLAARPVRRLRVVVIAYGVVAAWRRSGSTRRRLLRSSLRSASAVVAISEAGRTALIDEVRLEPERVHVAPLGVDGDWWQPLPPAQAGHVLAVGRDLARDYATFARAMESVPARGVIVAKPENLRGVQIPDNVEVRLNIDPAEVRELYRGAACVVVPVVRDEDPRGTESSGTIALIEGMACARATVVTDRATLRDYVDPGATAVAAATDADGLAATIRSVIEDPAHAARMGQRGRALVEERFTTQALGARLAQILRGAA